MLPVETDAEVFSEIARICDRRRRADRFNLQLEFAGLLAMRDRFHEIAESSSVPGIEGALAQAIVQRFD